MPSELPPVYILAGGRSSRYGSDKARADCLGQPLILRQATQLKSLGHCVIIVAREPGQYDDLGLHTIADIEPDQGPAAGLLTALRHRAKGWLLLTSCDLVILRQAWMTTLLDASAQHRADAIAFRDDRWQPFPGLYHTRLLDRPDVWRRFSLQHVLDHAPAHPLPLPADWPRILQANTPADLKDFMANKHYQDNSS